MSEPTGTITEKKCPKCKGGMPLYKVRALKAVTVVINKQKVHFSVDTTLHQCLRCKGFWRDDAKVKM